MIGKELIEAIEERQRDRLALERQVSALETENRNLRDILSGLFPTEALNKSITLDRALDPQLDVIRIMVQLHPIPIYVRRILADNRFTTPSEEAMRLLKEHVNMAVKKLGDSLLANVLASLSSHRKMQDLSQS